MNTRQQTLRSIQDLAAAGLVPGESATDLERVAARYAVAVTPAMMRLIDANDPADPIRRQFVPAAAELNTDPIERADPIGDKRHEKLPGLIHRYPDRVLLKVTHACPIYCRFCFRRETVGPGGEPVLSGAALDAAIAYVRNQPAVFEVILTGGDPLILSPRRIAELTERIAAIPHVGILRWHTRVPVVDPGRITDAMVEALKGSGDKPVYLAIHANHPRELNGAARAAIARLADRGIVLLGQTVLLAGVNNDVATLTTLFREFAVLRIKPYYLHHADLAPGTAHFRTSIAEGQAIMRSLRGRVSGIALPTYVLDIPGGFGKVPIGPAHVSADGNTVTDTHGHQHAYPPGP